MLGIFLILCASAVQPGEFKQDGGSLAIIVLSQPNAYHVTRAAAFTQHVTDQAQLLDDGAPPVYMSHEQWPSAGHWTVFPLVPHIVEELSGFRWILICEEETRINIPKLITGLAEYDPTKEIYLGRGLVDTRHTIIHHFHQPVDGFSYPDFAAGLVFSQPLLHTINERLKTEPIHKASFSIDAKHELALFIWKEGEGVALTDSGLLCTHPATQRCATSHPAALPQCGAAVNEDDVFVAIKTCEKFHTERIPIVRRTWTDSLVHVEYYSETEDSTIPTIDLGVPNTERGHCGKTRAIMERAVREQHIRHRDWLVIADDDTLMSMDRLRLVLACYDASEAVALGERYGYSVQKPHGYNYITGGGGMVFSMEAVRQMMECASCRCMTDDQADDMVIGMWLKRLGIPVTHSALFHQARAADYAAAYLQRQTPVSFHKFWMNDPDADYKQYLRDAAYREEL